VRTTLAAGPQTVSSGVVPGTSTVVDRRALALLQQRLSGAALRFVLWDGHAAVPPGGEVAVVEFRSRRALFRTLWDPELNFGDAYMFGAVHVRGDLEAALEAIYRVLGPVSSRRWWQASPANGLGRARDNVHYHYDLGNDFYRLWLDRDMVYTCAFFPTPDCTLEAAQTAKMDRICRKLRLRAGERVIEAGSGWGALALHMARRWGVRVRAFNVSREQVLYARERAAAGGLTHLAEFVEDDYRNVNGACDAFVSVGMLEHVGAPDYASLGRVIHRALTPNGRGLLHFIGRNQPSPLNPWIRKRIFPGASTPTLREVFEPVLEPYGFSVLDVENLRLHYAATLAHWRRRFSVASDAVRRMFDDAFVRAWDLYLAGSQAAFASGSLQLFQVLFARGESNDIPWTRDTSHGNPREDPREEPW
jgi:cyclopropane-fatty-acyl-phospholipid synthase